MEAQLINQGIDLMLYGMGTVFAFLTVLVACTSLMSTLVGRYFPETTAPEVAVSPLASTPKPQHLNVDARTLEVIKKAVDMHRSTTS